MAKQINDNQSQKKYYPVRKNPNKPWEVTLVEITEEQYRSIYHEIWATRKREQEHGRCMCPKRYLWKCDGICSECEYHAPGDILSTNVPSPDGKGNMYDYIPDQKQVIEELILDRDLLNRLINRFRELDFDTDQIIDLKLDGHSELDIARILGRNENTINYHMKRIREKLRKILDD